MLANGNQWLTVIELFAPTQPKPQILLAVLAVFAAVASAQYYYGGYAAYPAYSYGYAYPSYGYAAYPGYYLKK